MGSIAARSAVKKNEGILQKLQNIKIGGGGKNGVKMKKRDMVFILRNLSILVDNGLSLPKGLETMVREKSLRKYQGLLETIKRRVENGDAFSDALALFPDTFSDIIVSQVRVGEKGGTIPATLERIMLQLENADNMRSKIIKKLAYPFMLVVAGTGSITFMLTYVIPTFQTIYEENGAKLPAVTELLISFGEFATNFGWLIVLAVVALVASVVYVRRVPAGRMWMDTWLLKVPMLGQWFKNIAVLQFMEVLGNLMESGFTVVEALVASGNSVGNRRVRKSIHEMREAMMRGEKFSNELQRHGDLFPPVVNQLVVVGEQTGTLAKTTEHIRAHLRREVETYTNVMVGTIEPVMTIGLACAIGTILLAIYLPMFDMIGAMNPEG